MEVKKPEEAALATHTSTTADAQLQTVSLETRFYPSKKGGNNNAIRPEEIWHHGTEVPAMDVTDLSSYLVTTPTFYTNHYTVPAPLYIPPTTPTLSTINRPTTAPLPVSRVTGIVGILRGVEPDLIPIRRDEDEDRLPSASPPSPCSSSDADANAAGGVEKGDAPSRPAAYAQGKQPRREMMVVRDGVLLTHRGYEVCGHPNKNGKPCIRIGFCPFHKHLPKLIPVPSHDKDEGDLEGSENNIINDNNPRGLTPQVPSMVPNTLPIPAPSYRSPFRQNWTPEEHLRFLTGLNTYGKGNWLAISQHVGSRNSAQVLSHAQKYFLRQSLDPRLKNKKSIHDMTISVPSDSNGTSSTNEQSSSVCTETTESNLLKNLESIRLLNKENTNNMRKTHTVAKKKTVLAEDLGGGDIIDDLDMDVKEANHTSVTTTTMTTAQAPPIASPPSPIINPFPATPTMSVPSTLNLTLESPPTSPYVHFGKPPSTPVSIDVVQSCAPVTPATITPPTSLATPMESAPIISKAAFAVPISLATDLQFPRTPSSCALSTPNVTLDSPRISPYIHIPADPSTVITTPELAPSAPLTEAIINLDLITPKMPQHTPYTNLESSTTYVSPSTPIMMDTPETPVMISTPDMSFLESLSTPVTRPMVMCALNTLNSLLDSPFMISPLPSPQPHAYWPVTSSSMANSLMPASPLLISPFTSPCCSCRPILSPKTSTPPVAKRQLMFDSSSLSALMFLPPQPLAYDLTGGDAMIVHGGESGDDSNLMRKRKSTAEYYDDVFSALEAPPKHLRTWSN